MHRVQSGVGAAGEGKGLVTLIRVVFTSAEQLLCSPVWASWWEEQSPAWGLSFVFRVHWEVGLRAAQGEWEAFPSVTGGPGGTWHCTGYMHPCVYACHPACSHPGSWSGCKPPLLHSAHPSVGIWQRLLWIQGCRGREVGNPKSHGEDLMRTLGSLKSKSQHWSWSESKGRRPGGLRQIPP